MTSYTLHWFENRVEQIYCISRTWVRPVCSRLKRNCCAKDWVLVLSSMLDRNRVDNKSYCWAQTMVPHCFCDTKAKATFICGTLRRCSSQPISSKCKKVAIADCRHKCLPATNAICGQLKAISTISSQIKSVATVHRWSFIPLSRSVTNNFVRLFM